MRAALAVLVLAGCDLVLGPTEHELSPDAALPDGAGFMLVFDGADDFASFTRPVGDDFTIELWLRTDRSGGGTAWHTGSGLIYGDAPGGTVDDFGLALGPGPIAFGVGNPDRTLHSNGGVADNIWHHVAATRARVSGRIELYVDGVFQDSLPHENTNALVTTQKLLIGQANSSAPIPFFTGELDEVRIWSVVRTEAEINADRDRVLAGNEPGLVTYYRFDEGAGLRGEDSVGTANAASLGGSVESRAPTWAKSTAPIFRR